MNEGYRKTRAGSLKQRAQTMSGILQDADPDKACWSEADCGAILRHQLAAKLVDDLGLCFADASAVLAKTPALNTFGDVLKVDHPPVPVLRMVRQFAKLLSQKRTCYPHDVAMVLYYAAIAAAHARAGATITRLPDDEVRKGLQWCRGRTWLDASLRTLFAEALKQ